MADEVKYIGQVPVNEKIGEVLKKGAKGEDVKALQSLLYQIGFGNELNWDKYKDDGDYGDSATAAVLAFAQQNNIESDGTVLTEKLADELMERFDQLDEMQQISKDLKEGKLEEYCKNGSMHKATIAAMQTLLNELGYGEQLGWEKYKNDGFFGKGSIAAVKAFAADNNIEGVNGTVFTEKMATIVLEKLTPRYGKDWDKPTEVQDKMEAGDSPLFTYESNFFVGKKLLADKEFRPALDKITKFAEKHDILIHVTSSFRPDANVKGAVVKPARRSNHMVGHAFDFNLRYGTDHGSWANNDMMKKYPDVPAPVKAFIDEIRNDAGLRWGGDFKPIDAIHIDDGFNQNREAFDKKFKEIRATS